MVQTIIVILNAIPNQSPSSYSLLPEKTVLIILEMIQAVWPPHMEVTCMTS